MKKYVKYLPKINATIATTDIPKEFINVPTVNVPTIDAPSTSLLETWKNLTASLNNTISPVKVIGKKVHQYTCGLPNWISRKPADFIGLCNSETPSIFGSIFNDAKSLVGFGS